MDTTSSVAPGVQRKTEVITFDEDLVIGDRDPASTMPPWEPYDPAQMEADLYLKPEDATAANQARLGKFGVFLALLALGYFAYKGND